MSDDPWWMTLLHVFVVIGLFSGAWTTWKAQKAAKAAKAAEEKAAQEDPKA